MNHSRFIVALIAIFVTPAIGWAALSPVGSEFRVNTTRSGSFESPAVAVDAQGGSVVVWANLENYNPADLDGVFGQRFDSAGAALGTEFRVSSAVITAGPAVAMAPGGGFVVVWGSDDRVRGRRYDATGAALGGPFEVPADNDVSGRPAVAMDSAGSFTVVWQGYDLISRVERGPSGVFAQRYDQAGAVLATPIQVNHDPSAFSASIATLEDGFVITWIQQPAGSAEGTVLEDILFRRFDAAGMPLETAVRVNPAGFAAAPYHPPSVAADPSGGFVIAWWGTSTSPPESPPFLPQMHLFAQRYDSAGRPSGASIGTMTDLTLIFAGLSAPFLATDPHGGFAIGFALSVWSGSENNDPSEVYARRYDVTGASLGGEWQVVNQSSYAYAPAAAADSNGVLTVVWSDSDDILARRYAMPPTAAGETCTGDCTGDCNCNGEVTIDELITGVGIALNRDAARFGSCTAFDANADDQVTINELVRAVNHVMSGCPDE